MKVTMIGKSGCGKTSYMSGLYHVLGENPTDSISMSQTASSFQEGVVKSGNLAQISFRKRGFQFPMGTTITTSWAFNIKHYHEIMFKMEWIDYRGGIIDDIFNPDEIAGDNHRQKQIIELLKHISDSDSILLFLDSVILTSYDDVDERRYQSGASAIETILDNFSTFNPGKQLKMVIVLTKADSDLIDASYKENNFEKLIELGVNTLSRVPAMCKNTNGWQGGIVAVGSVGEGRVRSNKIIPTDFRDPIIISSEISAHPRPLNVELPLYYIFYLNLEEANNRINYSVTQKTRDYDNTLKKDNYISGIREILTGKNELRDTAEKIAQEKQKEMLQLEKIRDAMQAIYNRVTEKVRSL